MKMPDWDWLKAQPEGQFFERKTCYEYSGPRPRRRKARDVAWDVAETLSAMANADGGTLALGLEDDGRPTGVDYPPDRETLRWLRQFDDLGLSGNQKRLLVYARTHDGYFTSRAYQRLTGVDIYTASRDIKDLIRKGVVRRIKKGGRIYKLVEPSTSTSTVASEEEFQRVVPILREKGFLQNRDVRQALGLSRPQAFRLLQHWVSLGLLRMEGKGRGARYVPTQNVSL